MSLQTTRSLRRPIHDRVIAGVCSGLGRYFNIDATMIRIGWIILLLIGGSGVMAYLVTWFIVPDDTGQRTKTPLVILLLLFGLPLVLGCLWLIVLPGRF